MPGDRDVTVRLRADISNFQRQLGTAAGTASMFAKRLDEADGRMANLVQTGLALAPALVPIGAAAVPAVAGLTLQLGLAAGAGATALLAFNGVGDGLKALNAYQLKPTSANFEKLQQAMDKLGPAGQEFVLSLDKMTPKFHELQNLAEQGLLPGVTDGLNELMDLMPQARDMVGTFSSTLGELTSEAGDNLNDPRWVDFFDYIDRTAGPVLLEMGKTFGNVVEGLANTLEAFDPLSRDFSTGLLEWSRGFADATKNLDDNQGFQDFITYVQTNGPRALDTLGSIGGALVNLVEAAAPVGSASLVGLKVIAETISAIADSPAGPVLISLAAAVGVLGRSMKLLETVGLRGGGTGFLQNNYVKPGKSAIATVRELTAANRELSAVQKEARAAQGAYLASLRVSSTNMEMLGAGAAPASKMKERTDALVAANERQAKSAARVGEAEQAKSAALRAGAAAAGKAVAVAGGLALATSGLADKTGLSNTASMALMGTIAGPWGAAIGGGVGLVMDLASANNSLESSMKAVDRSMGGTSLKDQATDLQAAQKAVEDYRQRTSDAFDITKVGSLKGTLEGVSDWWTHAGDEAQRSITKQNKSFMDVTGSLETLQGAMGGLKWEDIGHGARMAKTSMEGWQTTLNTTLSAFSAAGKSQSEAMNFLNKGPDAKGWEAGKRLVLDYVQGMDSAQGKSKAVGDAMAALGNQMATNADQATALKAAMDALFGVELSQSQATDEAVRSLRDMQKAVRAAGKDLLTNSGAALDARDSIRSYVSAQLDKVNADAAADGSGRKAAKTLMATRDHIIAAAHAAGLGKKQIGELVNEMGLAPKNIETIIKTPNLLTATEQVKALGHLYGLTPKQLRTVVSAIGAGKSRDQIRELLKQYGLTPRQISTVLKAVDQASAKARAAKKAHEDFAKAYQAYLNANDQASSKAAAAKKRALDFAKKYLAALLADNRTGPGVAAARAMINSLRNKTITLTTNIVRHYSSTGGGTKGKPLPDLPGQGAGGAFFAGSTRHMAAGGYTDSGDYVPRVSQIRQGGGNILWSEPETGWEAYISGKPGMKDRNLTILSMAADRLGASVVRNAAGSITPMASGGIDDLHYRHNIRGVTHELGKLIEALKTTRQARKDYSKTVAQAFVTDPFGGTLGGFDSQVAYETRRIRGARADLTTLRKHGLSGALYKDLAASGNATLIDQFSHLTRAQVSARERAYNVEHRQARGLGDQAATRVYSQRTHELSHEIVLLRRELHQLRHGKHIGNTNIGRQINHNAGGKKKSSGNRRLRHA